jgi:hypothetical protein
MSYINLYSFLFHKKVTLFFQAFSMLLHLLQIQRVKTKAFFRLNFPNHTFSVYNNWYKNEITPIKCERMKYYFAEISRKQANFRFIILL